MFDAIAKTAVVGSMISLVRRVSGRDQTSVMGAIGLVAAGVILGAGAALVLAPKSGAELRADVKKRARQLTSNATDKFERVRDAAMEQH